MGWFSAISGINRIMDVEGRGMGYIRIAKYETLIGDINESIKKINEQLPFPLLRRDDAKSLEMIYDYDKLNEYGKIIRKKSTIKLDGDKISWESKYADSEFKNAKVCIDAAKDFVQYCRRSENIGEGYKFIFWAMMVLTVDKTDAEEHLSLICDFARMLHISDAELEDIVYVIKCVYHKAEPGYTFKSEKVPSIFGGLLELYK